MVTEHAQGRQPSPTALLVLRLPGTAPTQQYTLMDWTQHAKQLFQMPKPAHFTNHCHCCECAEHDATFVAHDVDSIGIEQLGNPGWDPLCFVSPEGFLYYLPALIRITLDTMAKPQERYLDQLLFHLIRDGKDHDLVRACSPDNVHSWQNFWRI
jgi:hypothetical protein